MGKSGGIGKDRTKSVFLHKSFAKPANVKQHNQTKKQETQLT